LILIWSCSANRKKRTATKAQRSKVKVAGKPRRLDGRDCGGPSGVAPAPLRTVSVTTIGFWPFVLVEEKGFGRAAPPGKLKPQFPPVTVPVVV